MLKFARARSRDIARSVYPIYVPPPTPENILGTRTPGFTDDGDYKELGLIFTANVSGTIVGIRMYKTASEPVSSITGRIWSAGGSLLASATFPTISTGWNEVMLATPLSINADTNYVVSSNVSTSGGIFYISLTNSGLSSEIVSSPGGNIKAIAGGARYNMTAGSFPSTTFLADTNALFFRDVLFLPS